MLGYVTTSYGKKSQAQVQKEIDQWLETYPRIHGIFFDEMWNEDSEGAVKHQTAFNRYAHGVGCSMTVANAGTQVPSRYFGADAADVIVVYEDEGMPEEEQLKRYRSGECNDYPASTRGVLVHSEAVLHKGALQVVLEYAKWVYVTESPYRPGDAKAANPWEHVSKHLEGICKELSSQ